jgi:predicted nucleic-acid-binding Zn-ribbon protein
MKNKMEDFLRNNKSDEYKRLKNNYNIEHREVCPNCGSAEYDKNLIPSIMDELNIEDVLNKKECICLNCGFKHNKIDRISINEFRNKKTI